MATKIPPHNLGEVIDATLHLLANPDATPDDLMAFVKGPDFPTGAQILGRQGILDAYRSGRGSIKMRAVAEIEQDEPRRSPHHRVPRQVSVESTSTNYYPQGPATSTASRRCRTTRPVARPDLPATDATPTPTSC